MSIDTSTSTSTSTDARMRIPDFSILHAKLPSGSWCCCASQIFSDAILSHAACPYCTAPFGYGVPIYRDPLSDGELTAHLSCAIEHDEVRVWTPADFAAKLTIDTAECSGAERLLSAIAASGVPHSAACACVHLLAFAEFYADSSIVIMCATPISCFMCDVTLSAEEFSALLVRTLTSTP